MIPARTSVLPSTIGHGNGLFNMTARAISPLQIVAILVYGPTSLRRHGEDMFFRHDARGSTLAQYQALGSSTIGDVSIWHGAAAQHSEDALFMGVSVVTRDGKHLVVIAGKYTVAPDEEVFIRYGSAFGPLDQVFPQPAGASCNHDSTNGPPDSTLQASTHPGTPPAARNDLRVQRQDTPLDSGRPAKKACAWWSMVTDNRKYPRNLWSGKLDTLCTTVVTWLGKAVDDAHSRLRRLRWRSTHFTVLMAQLLIVMYAMITPTNLEHEYRLPRGSRTIGNWMSGQHEVALHQAAFDNIRLAVRLERAERDVMTRVVEGTASSTDKSLLLALASRDQMLGNEGTSTWC